jgi:hypothetical protein
LKQYEVHADTIALLLTKFGPAACLKQAAALPFRESFGADRNRAGLLVQAIRQNWEMPKKVARAEIRAISDASRNAERQIREQQEATSREELEAKLVSIAARFTIGELPQEDALMLVHGAEFSSNPDVKAIQRRIAENLLRPFLEPASRRAQT